MISRNFSKMEPYRGVTVFAFTTFNLHSVEKQTIKERHTLLEKWEGVLPRVTEQCWLTDAKLAVFDGTAHVVSPSDKPWSQRTILLIIYLPPTLSPITLALSAVACGDLPITLSICLSLYLSVCLSTSLSVHLSYCFFPPVIEEPDLVAPSFPS